MKIAKGLKREAAVAIVALVLVASATAAIVLTARNSPPAYYSGDRWTWQVTRQFLDPLTDNVTSTTSYEQTSEYLRRETRGTYTGDVFKLTVSGQSGQYGQVFRISGGDETTELLNESFENDQKASEYAYSEPVLIRKYPLSVGLRFSDAKPVSGYDNTAGVDAIHAFETRVTEVAARETLTLPSAIDTYKLRTWGSSTGTMTIDNTASQIVITYEENAWYSESIKEVVKSETETTTVITTSLATSVTKTRETRTLSSYSL